MLFECILLVFCCIKFLIVFVNPADTCLQVQLVLWRLAKFQPVALYYNFDDLELGKLKKRHNFLDYFINLCFKVKKTKRLRAGKGKMRNRRFKMKRGPCVVYEKDEGITRAFRNIPGTYFKRLVTTQLTGSCKQS